MKDLTALFFPSDQEQAQAGEKKNSLSSFIDCVYVLYRFQKDEA